MPGISQLLYPLSAAFAWLLVIAKFRHVRRDRGNPAQISMLAAFFFLAVAFTIGSPGVWQFLNGGPHGDMATLYAQSTVICAMAAIITLLLQWNYPPEQAKRKIGIHLGLLGMVLTVLVSMYLVVDRQHSDAAGHLASWYASSTTFALYILAYQSIFGATMLEIVVLCRRYSRAVTDRRVRMALNVTALGALTALLYTGVRLLDLAVAPFGISLTPLENVAEISTSIGSTLLLIGLTLPSWAARFTAARVHLRQRRSYQSMEPLWRALAEASPDIVLEPGPRGSWLRHGDFDFHLRRRIIEIHDAQLILRAYRTQQDEQTARLRAIEAGLTGIDAAAYVEAVCLHAALLAKQHGRKGDGALPDHQHAGSSIDDELRWLTRLSKAFTQTQAQAHAQARATEHPSDQGVAV